MIYVYVSEPKQMDIAGFVLLVGIVSAQVVGSTTSVADLPRAGVGCGEAILKAEARTKHITSPAYPDPFPGNTKCTWALYAKNGKRIRMEFQVFKLLQPINGKCEHHFVIVKSPFSTQRMGPFCGEVGLPTIVSTGNLIYVELHTVHAVDTDNYQGFKLAFKETVESSSYELRSDNTAEDNIVTVDPETMNILSPTPPILVRSKAPGPTKKSWRFRPARRPSNQVRKTNSGSVRRPSMPNARYPRIPARNRFLSEDSKVIVPTPETKSVKMEIIIAIAASAVVVIAIVITIAVLYSKNRRKDGSGDAALGGNGGNVELAKQIPVAETYPTLDPSYYMAGYPGYVMEYPEVHSMNSTTSSRTAAQLKRKNPGERGNVKEKRKKKRTKQRR